MTSKEYTQIYYDEGFADIVIEKFNKELKEKAIKIESFTVTPGRNGISLFASYIVREKQTGYITEKKEGNQNV